MRYMIRDPHLGFIVKDPDLRVQCHYDSGAQALDALRNGIGSNPTEILRREVYTPAIDVLEKTQALLSHGNQHIELMQEMLEQVEGPKKAPPHRDLVRRFRESIAAWRAI